MTDYAVIVRHPGFIDRFLKSTDLPEGIGTRIWWATDDKEILRFKRREAADNCKMQYELHFAAEGERSYSFVVMKTVMVPKWVTA